MALTRQQTRAFTARYDVWRPSRTVTAGKPGSETHTRVATNIAGHTQYTDNVSDESPAGRIKRAMILTMDMLHFEAAANVRDGDLIHCLTTGEWHRVEGAPHITNGAARRPANAMSVRVTTVEKPPAGVS
jgi:hypothetical protein